MTELIKKINAKKAKIGVIGLGYVGLPLALQFAKNNFETTGFDLSLQIVEKLNRGKSNIDDVSDEQLSQSIKKDRISFSADFSKYTLMDVLIICVPTPLDKHKVPDLTAVIKASESISETLRKDQFIILESTTYPGTTEEVIKPLLDKKGLLLNKDYFLAFSPERIDPGNKNFNVSNTPKIVGGLGEESQNLVKALYESIIPKVHSVSSPRAAEMTKLLENIFRSVNIALINEMALLSGKLNIDIWEVIEAAATKPYGFMPFHPGPGIGGHCIPLDPFYLSWKAKEFNFYSRFIELAGEINDQMPHFIVSKINSALNSQKKSIHGSKILILGASYKKDIGDLRESPSLTIIKELLRKKGEVSYHDPLIPDLHEENIPLQSVALNDPIIKKADIVVVLTDHSHLSYEDIAQKAVLIVDTRNAIKNRTLKNVFRL